jgi:hypothetical protein
MCGPQLRCTLTNSLKERARLVDPHDARVVKLFESFTSALADEPACIVGDEDIAAVSHVSLEDRAIFQARAEIVRPALEGKSFPKTFPNTSPHKNVQTTSKRNPPTSSGFSSGASRTRTGDLLGAITTERGALTPIRLVQAL